MQVKCVRTVPETVRYRLRLRPAITGAPSPKYNGDEEVRAANKQLARDARKAMRGFRRSLPKGTKI